MLTLKLVHRFVAMSLGFDWARYRMTMSRGPEVVVKEFDGL